jgi:hypothetical protein
MLPRRLLLLATASLLTGCVPALIARVSLDSKIETPDRGNLVGSIGCIDLPAYHHHEVDFRSKDQQIKGWIIFLTNSGDVRSQLDWDEPNWKGIAFNIALPPGEYEFFRLRFGDRGLGFVSPPPFSLPFQIKRGEILYMGRIECYYSLYKPYPRSDRYVPSDPYFVISDQTNGDMPVIRKKFPDLEGHSLRIDVPAVDSLEAQLIRSTPR